jgi:T5SS/PEP-CTERM-associated repeat protein
MRSHTIADRESGWRGVVGSAGNGRLNIKNGGVAETGAAFVGESTGGAIPIDGSVLVEGANSTWTLSGLTVGDTGLGSLSITDGGHVSDVTGYIGYDLDARGHVSVEGTNSSWTHSGDLYVGEAGQATLNIAGGGQVACADGFIAYSAGTGTVNVAGSAPSGTGSNWTVNGRLMVGGIVGSDGTATLRIQPEGNVNVVQDTVLFSGDRVILEGGTLSTTEISFNMGGPSNGLPARSMWGPTMEA